MTNFRTLHCLRVQGRRLSAQIAAEAQAACLAAGDAGCTDIAIARRWGCSDRAVAKFFDPASGKALTIGDAIALPRKLFRNYVIRLLAVASEGLAAESVEKIALKLGHAMGSLMDDLAHDRHARLADSFAEIAEIALQGHLAAVRKAESAEGGR